ncbi:trigger factor [Schlesneria paludicola]|uniref:trigger factor n=1 Tax=Schlesneria paludicola TaxID=360056 RepID=UPI000299F0A9|nr:trigger factor [Schlesneria paludicola]
MSEAANTVSDAVAEADSEQKYKLSLKVDIENVGPCRKHVRVTVPRADIDHFSEEAVKEIVDTAAVPGFRKGRVPASLAQKRFKTEISNSVRQRVLMQSLEQLADENTLDPINEPDFDVESLAIPEQGDFEYEFDVEVRPSFDLPKYDGLKIERPSREVTDADVDAYLEKFRAQYATNESHDGPAEANDFVVASVEFTRDGQPFRKISSIELQLKPIVRFRDAEVQGFDKLMAGAVPGTEKQVEVTISQEAEQVEMRGEKLNATILVGEVLRVKMPDLGGGFLDRIGYSDVEALRTEVRGMLERQVVYEQRQAVRKQVIEKITESATWDLPEQLVRKQTENALRREILEMEQAGFTTQQIMARENELRQNAITSTRQALKEHFVLDKIAEQEKVEVTPTDIDAEIHMMAIQRGENPRRVRARLVKSGVIENLEAQIRERKAVDVVLKSAVFEDVPAPVAKADDVQALSISVCGTSTVVVNPADDEE